MAVTVRAPFPAGTAGDIVAASTTITTSVTLLTGDDLELHCAYDKASDTGVTLSAKLDPTGANLSPDGSSVIVHANGATVGFEQVFWWLNSTLSPLLGAGAKNVTVTASTSADSMEQKAYAITGADHNAPTVTTASGSGASAAVTSASCPANGLAVGHFVGGSSFTATNNTNTLLQSGTSGNAGWNIAGNTAAGAGSTISLTGTLPADFWAAIATVWAPAGAGAPASVPVRSQRWPRLMPRWPLPQQYVLPPKVITPPPYFKDWSTGTTPDLIVSAEDWGLLANAGLNHSGDFAATYEDYFTTRQAQGYNGVEVSIFSYATLSGGANGADSDGTFPFTPNTDPSGTPNATFWGRRDTFLTKAAAHGCRVFLSVTTPNIHNTPTSFTLGWTSTQWSNFGTFLGNRYASQANIMWIVGDDYFDDIDANLTAFLSALRAAGATQPISIQNYQEATSRRDIFDNGVRPWGNTNAQYNWGYSYNFWYDVVEKMGLEANPLPYMAADGFFIASGATGLTDVQLIRRMIWWALSSGSKGFNIGDNDVWTWSSTALAQLTSKTIYTTVIPAIASYFRSLPNWHLLVADTSNVLVTSGRGTHGSAITSGGGGTPYTSNTDSYVTASRAVDSSLAVIYMSHASSITIDESQMVAGYKAYWVDPVTGSATLTTSGPSYSSSGLGNNSDAQADWVLVLRQPASGVGATLTVTSSISAAGRVDTSTGAALAVTAAVTAAGATGGVTGTASLAVTSAIVATGTSTGAASVASTSTVAAAGNMAAAGGASRAVTATISNTGSATGTSSVAVTVSIIAAGNLAATGSASLPITATITAASQPAGGASLALTDSITATGSTSASSAVAISSTITASGTVATSSGATLAVTATVTAASSPGAPASLTVTSTITAVGSVMVSTGATLAVAAAITAASSPGAPGALSITAAITASGILGTSQGATQPVTVTLTAAGAASYQRTASLLIAAAISAAGVAGVPPTAGTATAATGAVPTATPASMSVPRASGA
jgi:hypothetical protein